MNKNSYYIGFIILFFIIVSSPFWGFFFNNETDLNENRIKSRLNDVRGIRSLNSYIEDNHGFRSLFSDTYMKLYINLLKESPMPKQSIIGKDNWYFLGDDYNHTYSSSLGIFHFPDNTLKQSVNNVLKIKNYCDSIGTKFYLVIPPDKNNVYSEFLNEKPNKKIRFKEAFIDKLSDKVNIIDLYPFIKLKKNTESEDIYYKTDTHWNYYGAYLASKYITDSIKESVNLTPINDNYISIKKIKLERDGDLTKMLDLKIEDIDFEIRDSRDIQFSIKKIRNDQLSTRGDIIFFHNLSYPNNANAIIFKDFFFTAMTNPFLSTISNAVLFEDCFFDSNIIDNIIRESGKPDFILLEVVERKLIQIEYR